MEIKVLGIGCPKCKRLEQIAREAASDAGIEATFTKVTQIKDIMAYPITGTPALVVDEQVVSSGRIPQKQEVITWLMNAKVAL
jgi:small redox-active disulfide protein 2